MSVPGGKEARTSASAAGKFFKIFNGFTVLGGMAGPRRQLAEPHRLQLAAQRRLVQRDAELLEDPLNQILEPPAHHPIACWYRSTLHLFRQRLTLRGIQS